MDHTNRWVPSPLGASIYPLDGFMCVLSGYPTLVFEETKAKRSVFFFFWKEAASEAVQVMKPLLPLCGMYFLLDL